MEATTKTRLRKVLAVVEIVLGVACAAIGILAFVSVADCPDTVPECEQFVRGGGRLFLVTGCLFLIAGAAAWFAKTRAIVVEQIVLVLAIFALWGMFNPG